MRSIQVLVAAGTVAAAGAWVPSVNAQRIVGVLPASFQNLANAQVVEIRDGADTVLLKGTFVTESESDEEIERTAALSGNRGSGKAEIELERSLGTITKQEIEVGLKRLPPQASLKLYVDGTLVSAFTTNGKGSADLKYTTNDSSTNSRK